MDYNIEKKIITDLLSMQDLKYQAFHSKLMPTVNPEKVIGVRMPLLRNYAQKLSKNTDVGEYLNILPHTYYEENNLHGLLIERMKNYEKIIDALDKFLPYVDNWATCDMIAPKIFKKHLPELEGKIREWISSQHTYTIRFGINMLLKYYLDDAFKQEYLDLVASVDSEEYYVKMMIAWYFATALAKQYETTIPYMEKRCLKSWIHNKTIQKAIESYRISPIQKEYLRKTTIRKTQV